MKDVGLNLFSLRTLISTEDDFLNTAIRLKEMGYSFLQYSGGKYEPQMIKRVLEESGMPIVLTHVPMERIMDETEALMEEHDIFGCKNIGLGYLNPEMIVDEELLKKTVEKLNKAARKMKDEGFSFYFHNHHNEFYTHNNVTVLDYMIENAPYINFTFDTYWAQYGGVNVLDYIEKLKGRIGCVHLKDYKIILKQEDDQKSSIVPAFAPVGYGNMDFKAIVPKMKEAGTEYFIVEQDDAISYEDPLYEVEKSIKYIKKEL